MSNRRRNEEQIKVTWIPMAVVSAAIAIAIGLSFVSLTNQIHDSGRQIHEMEMELKDLASQNSVAHAKISQLSSRTSLQRRLTEGFIKMQPITDDRIVHVGTKTLAPVTDEARKVANRGGAR
jgi:hypothetical protein